MNVTTNTVGLLLCHNEITRQTIFIEKRIAMDLGSKHKYTIA